MTAPRDFDAAALRSIVPWTFTPDVAAGGRREVELAGGLECSFVGRADVVARMIVSWELVTRGSGGTTFHLDSDLEPGMIEWHNHPHPCSVLAPSPEDLEGAIATAKRGCGSAICTNDFKQLLVIREPRPIRPQIVPRKVWRLGPAMLVREDGLLLLTWKAHR